MPPGPWTSMSLLMAGTMGTVSLFIESRQDAPPSWPTAHRAMGTHVMKMVGRVYTGLLPGSSAPLWTMLPGAHGGPLCGSSSYAIARKLRISPTCRPLSPLRSPPTCTRGAAPLTGDTTNSRWAAAGMNASSISCLDGGRARHYLLFFPEIRLGLTGLTRRAAVRSWLRPAHLGHGGTEGL